MNERKYAYTYPPFDKETQLEDGGIAITLSRVGRVNTQNRILDFGEDQFDGSFEAPYVRGEIAVLVSFMDATTGNEFYELDFQLSDDPDFVVPVLQRARMRLGPATDNGATVGLTTTSLGGVPVYLSMMVDNQIGRSRFRFGRLRIEVGGFTPNILFKAWLVKSVRVGGGI